MNVCPSIGAIYFHRSDAHIDGSTSFEHNTADEDAGEKYRMFLFFIGYFLSEGSLHTQNRRNTFLVLHYDFLVYLNHELIHRVSLERF